VLGLFLGMTVECMDGHTAEMEMIGVGGAIMKRIWEVYAAGKGTIILGQALQLPASQTCCEGRSFSRSTLCLTLGRSLRCAAPSSDHFQHQQSCGRPVPSCVVLLVCMRRLGKAKTALRCSSSRLTRRPHVKNNADVRRQVSEASTPMSPLDGSDGRSWPLRWCHPTMQQRHQK
jgi:hypothetical protein